MIETGVIELSDKKYPELLKKIGKPAPKKFYYKGNWDIFSAQGGPASGWENCLGVVGSRHLTTYGRRCEEKLVTEIALAGVTIVSGFMYGGDEAAHSAAVKCGGKTIAVMPCGIDRIHPEYQTKLYREILKTDGLIISEYENDFMPQNWSYVQRDRIVAGLCQAVFVVEAGEKSGSLLTAGYAKQFGRKVFALPGPITSEVSKGTLKLIKEGAEPVMEANDILEYYKLKSKNITKCPIGQSVSKESLENKILEFLRREPAEADSLARALCVPASQLGITLSMMQLKNIINQENGKYYVN